MFILIVCKNSVFYEKTMNLIKKSIVLGVFYKFGTIVEFNVIEKMKKNIR